MTVDSTTGVPQSERIATVACQFCSTLNRVDLSRVDHHPKCGQCGRPILLDRPLSISDDSFQPVIAGTDVPVVVDFYADWCGPCKMMAPILDELAHDRKGEVLVVKLNTDQNPGTMIRFGVRGIPTLIVFTGGREATRQTGAVPRAQLDAILSGALAK
jgi:thioredoxin 2